MTPAEHAKAIERAVEIYSRDFAIYCDTQALTDFRVCLVSFATLQAAIQAGVGAAANAAAPAQAVPAPGVDAVSEREFKQFLSDVLTAAGLVTHGKKCKDLGRRLGEMSMRLLTAPKTAAAPGQALDALKKAGAIAVSALETNSRDIADWREDIDQIAARAAQKGGAHG